MGKGDIKSRKGKVWNGTFGVRRRRKALKTVPVAAPKVDSKTK